ncbi:putative uncharacterized protein [Lachnospiraceae bacterium CAG:215]|nr:putative uncharacterized protein [Lachnospiraceae bacterium CAG:215]
MTSDKFCCGMYNNICSILKRTQKIRRRKCIIRYKHDSMSVCHIRCFLNIHKVRIRVADRFDEYCFRILFDRFFPGALFVRIYKSCFNPLIPQRMLQQIIRSSVNVFGGSNMIPCFRKILKRICDRCCPGCNCKCGGSVLQSRNPLFEYILRRVSQSSVNISVVPKSEPVRSMLTVIEHIRSRLIYRYSSCSRNRIRMFLPCVYL